MEKLLLKGNVIPVNVFFTACVFVALALCCPAAQAAPVTIDRIMAIVNGEIVTQSEYLKYKGMLLMGSPEKPTDLESDRQLLAQLIDKKIILQEAKKMELSVRDKEIDQAYEDVLRRNKLDERTLKIELAKLGASIADYKKVLEGEILQSRTIGRAVHAKINITDEQMEEFYEQNMRGQGKTGPRVRIQQILLLIPKGASASKISDIEKSIKDLHKRIAAGEDFGKLAVKHSEGAGAQLGGDIGFFYKGELMSEIEELAFSLAKGQVSPVFRTELGFHLVKVIDRISDTDDNETAKTGTWKDRKKDIYDILYGSQFEKEITQWMKGLKEKAYVEIN